jgi:aldose 1-epimerase
VLKLNASRYLPVDGSLIPTGVLQSVAGTPFDFVTPAPIGARLGHDHEQLRHAGGYDHTWALDDAAVAAEVYAPVSGRRMRVYTTQPGVQIYSGNFLDGSVRGKGGTRYVRHAGFCLETHHFPDSPNQPAFPRTALLPGEIYRQSTRYRFSVASPG